ncbi:hypothetical protein [Ilumatobacter sp.]|uniref:hypothetical protein n=1 Tax=Ilumatobacter sp. TaxID=1967498 RepID=UPI003F6CA43B
MMDQVFGEPFSANEYDADPMVAMSELERAIQDRLAEHELRFTAARRVINVNDAQNEPINTAAVVSIPSISPTPTPSTSGMNVEHVGADQCPTQQQTHQAGQSDPLCDQRTEHDNQRDDSETEGG